MERQQLLQEASAFLARFSYEVKINNAIGLFDINIIAEDFLIPILSIALKCPRLINQNRIRMNFPAIDLGCSSSRTSIQVTSDASSSKICETLKKFEEYDLSNEFDIVYVYVITKKQKNYTSKELAHIVDGLSVDFDVSKNIIDYENLAKLFSELSSDELRKINAHFKAEFDRKDADLKFRCNLDSFLKINKLKIDEEKRTKKYIPSIFVETSVIKEDMRYFANPYFFFRKIDDDIKKVSFSNLNKLLNKAKIKPLSDGLFDVASLDEPNNIGELNSRFSKQREVIKDIVNQLIPFAGYKDRARVYTPDDISAGYWEVFSFSIRMSGGGIHDSIEDVLKKIKIACAKIFLITGMAGQGKTNFICDVIENQFSAFEIPGIFIPGRALNDYSGPNRILSYIKNNRFSPDFNDIHELFSLLNKIAEEFNKPFVISIDGINEVGDLDRFSAELRVFLDAMCQYDYVKVILSCRNEFFEHKFSSLFDSISPDLMYRVEDLRVEMTEENKDRLIEAYFKHFSINGELSAYVSDFLKNDLILLRIFSEIHQGKSIGYVSDIYKGDIFEQYLLKKVNDIPNHSGREVLNTLYKICDKMLDGAVFSQMPIEGFSESERQVLDSLIGEDIVLRRDLPATGLASLGIENISFTYDELRDFLLAFYTLQKLSTEQSKVELIFSMIAKWPIYEGFLRYAYVLSRKNRNSLILSLCENLPDFKKHYINNINLLSSDIQSENDLVMVKNFLDNAAERNDCHRVAWFLFGRRNDADYLNINVLLEHVRKLNQDDLQSFINVMFHDNRGYGNWREVVNDVLSKFNNLPVDRRLNMHASTLALVLYFSQYAHWNTIEKIMGFFSRFKCEKNISSAIDACRKSNSEKMLEFLKGVDEL
ncbi:SMEK domain-containing protein [Plesiomonas shigelloides]|uniref:SMEK domain-containing protein n=1 Tax=Plesiomonas shigelloides TaxID=703 RepID=UPI00387EF452